MDQHWTTEEDAQIIAESKTMKIRDICQILESRTYWAIKARLALLRQNNTTGYKTRSGPPLKWTPLEDLKLKHAWGRLSPSNLAKALPGRSYAATATRARILRLKGDEEAARRRRQEAILNRKETWKPHEDRAAIEHRYNRSLWPAVLPDRTAAAVERRLFTLFGSLNPYKWSEEEERLVLLIVRTRKKLLEGRTSSALNFKIQSIRQMEENIAASTTAITAACAWISDRDVKTEVEGELLVEVLTKKITIEDLPTASRAARTRIYGRRHYSLDVPIGDGDGAAWIDTIASDREHW